MSDADALRATGIAPATMTEQARRHLGSALTVAGHTAAQAAGSGSQVGPNDLLVALLDEGPGGRL
ncbi:hypothetical protein AB0L41_23960 [Amycolatopsis mediterranei]|uniref:hypothetical protein n=1 Tax=Amycolatopsis mediterranei TaxID=33910 RepID=UPI0034182969